MIFVLFSWCQFPAGCFFVGRSFGWFLISLWYGIEKFYRSRLPTFSIWLVPLLKILTFKFKSFVIIFKVLRSLWSNWWTIKGLPYRSNIWSYFSWIPWTATQICNCLWCFCTHVAWTETDSCKQTSRSWIHRGNVWWWCQRLRRIESTCSLFFFYLYLVYLVSQKEPYMFSDTWKFELYSSTDTFFCYGKRKVVMISDS